MNAEMTSNGDRLTLECRYCGAVRAVDGRLESREFKAIVKSWLDAHDHKNVVTH